MRFLGDFLTRLPQPFQVLFAAVGLLFSWAGASTFVEDMAGLVGHLQQHVGGIWLIAVGIISLFFGFAPGIVGAWSRFRKRKEESNEESNDVTTRPRLLANQGAVLAAHLGYDDVLSDPAVKKVWIAVMVGGHLKDMKDYELEKVEKLILALPSSGLIPHLYRARGDEQGIAYGIKSSVEAAYKASVNGASVVYQKQPIMQCLVVFRHDNDNWLRWEPILPSLKPKQWPSIVVGQEEAPEVFTAIADAFIRHHESGEKYVRPPEASPMDPRS